MMKSVMIDFIASRTNFYKTGTYEDDEVMAVGGRGGAACGDRQPRWA